MRIEETLRIFSDFDRLFGLGDVFSRSHEVFSQSQFSLADGSITPQWDGDTVLPDVGTWSDYLGGREGMRQKGWTIFTVVILKHICEQLQIPFQLLGQGDNQILITQYYEKPGVTIQMQHENFLASLNLFLETIGPPLKLEESWSSSHFFTYGKYPILKGVPLTLSLKKISRCGHLNNEGMINLDSIIGPNYTFIPGKLKAIELCLNRPFHGPSIVNKLKDLKKNLFKVPDGNGRQIRVQEEIIPPLQHIIDKKPDYLILLLSLIQSSSVGYPTIQASDQTMYGISDTVNSSLRELQEIHPLFHQLSSKLASFIPRMLDPPISGVQNSELLCLNPCGLRGSRPKDLMKRILFDYLPQIDNVVNETFLSIFTDAKDSQKSLAEALHSMRPLHPRIMSSIYESTPVGVAQSITRRLESTKH